MFHEDASRKHYHEITLRKRDFAKPTTITILQNDDKKYKQKLQTQHTTIYTDTRVVCNFFDS